MTGGIFTAYINSTDSLIPLLGPSARPDASATRWCITVGVTNICGLDVQVVCWFTDDMSLGCLKRLIIALSKGNQPPNLMCFAFVPERNLCVCYC